MRGSAEHIITFLPTSLLNSIIQEHFNRDFAPKRYYLPYVNATLLWTTTYRRSYISAYVLLNLLNEFGKGKMRDSAEHLITFFQRV